jgi:hypothetical protein
MSSNKADVFMLLNIYNLSFQSERGRGKKYFIDDNLMKTAIAERKRIFNRLRRIDISCRLTEYIEPQTQEDAIIYCFLYGLCTQYAIKDNDGLYKLSEKTGFNTVKVIPMTNNFVKVLGNNIFYLGKRNIEGKEFINCIFNIDKKIIDKFKC